MNDLPSAAVFLVIGVSVCALASPSVHADSALRRYYVDARAPNAADANPGTKAAPWRTIQEAALRAKPGDTVIVRGGIYHETVYVRTDRLSFIAEDGQRPVLDGARGLAGGFDVCARGVRIQGFEVRNYTFFGIRVKDGVQEPKWHSSPVDGTVIAFNHVHDIGRVAPRKSYNPGTAGIYVGSWGHVAGKVRIENNTVHDIRSYGGSWGFGEAYGIYAGSLHDSVIRRNLCYFADKTGLRLVGNNKGDRDTEGNVIEGNICIHNGYVGIDINHVKAPKAGTWVRHNFCGWNGTGINPKHVAGVRLFHNTVYGNTEAGIQLGGGDFIANPAIENNVLAGNPVAFAMGEITSGLALDRNLYQAGPPPSCLVWPAWYGKPCFTMEQVRAAGWEANGKTAEHVFADAGAGNFQLREGLPARDAAGSAADPGASRQVLRNVGARAKWGLATVPDLGAIPLTVHACSSVRKASWTRFPFSEDPGPGASWAVARTKYVAWFPKGTGPEWLVCDLPGGKVYELDHFMLPKKWIKDQDEYFKDVRLWVSSTDPVAWRPVPGSFRGWPAGHGCIFRLPPGTRASRVKLEILGNYGGDELAVWEFRLYGHPVAGKLDAAAARPEPRDISGHTSARN